MSRAVAGRQKSTSVEWSKPVVVNLRSTHRLSAFCFAYTSGNICLIGVTMEETDPNNCFHLNLKDSQHFLFQAADC